MGSTWCIDKGYGWKEDLENTEEYGIMKNANSEKISEISIKRGIKQIGTLGSGNHYLEIQVVKPEYIFDKKIAKVVLNIIDNTLGKKFPMIDKITDLFQEQQIMEKKITEMETKISALEHYLKDKENE